MTFKQAILSARLKVGLSQEKAGNAINRTRNAIKGYEEGISSPNPDQLVTLCKLYKTTPNKLLEFQQQNEEAKMKHTDLPWRVSEVALTRIESGDATICSSWVYGRSSTEEKANAAFIVKACNNHYQLIDALRELHRVASFTDYSKEMDIAIIKSATAIKQTEDQS